MNWTIQNGGCLSNLCVLSWFKEDTKKRIKGILKQGRADMFQNTLPDCTEEYK
jgi:hypothetical protein